MYVVARNADDHAYYLHALDLTRGLSDVRPPARIAANVVTDGVVFHPECQRNRPGLLLQGGVVYAAFGSLGCDRDCSATTPYRGWVIGHRASDLTLAAAFCTSPEASGHAGIWQGGSGLVGDGERLYFQTGNGPGPLGDAFVALRATPSPPGLALEAAHRPSNHAALDAADVDLGSGGPVWLPPGLLLGAGKEGRFALLESSGLRPVQNSPGPDGREGFQAFANSYHADPRAPACGVLARSAFPTNCDTAGPGCFIDAARYQNGEDCGPNVNAGPVFWRRAGSDFGLVFQMAGRDYLKAFRYDERARHLDERAFAVSSTRAPEGMSGGFASLSADGGTRAILWVSYPLGDPQWQNVPGRLAAFDPMTLQELWHDDGGVLFAKFTPPTIADGRVVRATLSGRVLVYGPQPEPPRTAAARALVRPGVAVRAVAVRSAAARRTRRRRRALPPGRRRAGLSRRAVLRCAPGSGCRRGLVSRLPRRHRRRGLRHGGGSPSSRWDTAGARPAAVVGTSARLSSLQFTGRRARGRTSSPARSARPGWRRAVRPARSAIPPPTRRRMLPAAGRSNSSTGAIAWTADAGATIERSGGAPGARVAALTDAAT